ncbi:MAG: hypothetical protein FWC97_04695 [Treponema sp.]|nr:hypothetical protein [Treponema sp.]
MGNILRHGIDMYKKTIDQKDSPLRGSPKQGEPDYAQDSVKDSVRISGKQKTVEGFIKTSKAKVSEPKPKPQPVFLRDTKPDLTPKELKEFSGGGVDTARAILYAAKGSEKGETILNKAVPESKVNLFTFLEDFSPEQLVLLLNDETNQAAALVLARLSSKLSAGTISRLPQNRKSEILKRIAHQGEILPEVLEQVSSAFREKVRNVSGGANDIKIDGVKTLTAILKQGDYAFGSRLINELEYEEPNIATNLKNKFYTIDDVINTVDRIIQDKLKIMTEREIAILLKGKSREFNEKILSNISAGRRQIIREENEVIGAVPKRDCEEIERDFLAWFRLARSKGEIILYDDKDVYV